MNVYDRINKLMVETYNKGIDETNAPKKIAKLAIASGMATILDMIDEEYPELKG